jgi:hypothetical protein
MNDKLEGTFMAYFKVLSLYLPQRTMRSFIWESKSFPKFEFRSITLNNRMIMSDGPF